MRAPRNCLSICHGSRRTPRTYCASSRSRNVDGAPTGESSVKARSERHARRNQWVVEKAKFYVDRQRLARRLRDSQLEARETVREHPELKSTFLSIQAAQEFANQRIKDPGDRERFMVHLRAVMATSIQKGEPLPEVRLKERSAEPHQGSAGRRPGRDEPTR